MSNIIKNNISGKKVLGLFILTNLVYVFMLFVTIPNTMVFSNGMKLLDMMPTGYDYNYVIKLLNTLGEKGRSVYLTYQIPVDMIYPLLFGLTYSLLLAYFLRKINKLNYPFSYFCLLPIIAGVSDYFENIGIIVMLKTYPNFTETTVTINSTFSIIKSISTSLFFVTLMIVLIQVGLNFIKKRQVNN